MKTVRPGFLAMGDRIWARGAATSTLRAAAPQPAGGRVANGGTRESAARGHEQIRWRRIGQAVAARRKRKAHGFSSVGGAAAGGCNCLEIRKNGATTDAETGSGAGVVPAGPARQLLVLLNKPDTHRVNRLLCGDTRAA
jgi:hypothetical protein